MTYQEIIEAVLSATQDNGKILVRKLEHREALEKIRDFDLQKDWIEQKELTKIGKILGGYLLKVYPDLLPQNNPSYKGYSVYAHDFVPADLRSAYRGGGGERFGASQVEREQSKGIFDHSARQAAALLPVADHFEAIKKRSLRNGRPSKEHAERIRKEQIKGELDPALDREITRLKEKWRPVIYDHTLQYLKAQREMASNFLDTIGWGGPVPPRRSDQEAFEKYERECGIIARYLKKGVITRESTGRSTYYLLVGDHPLEGWAKLSADQESEDFHFKMASKLGGLVTDIGKTLQSVEDWAGQGHSPFESTMRFRFSDGSNFLLKNSIVASVSPLGTFFYRYPSTFHDAYNAKNEKIANPDEYNVKAAFIADVGHRKRTR